MSSTAVPRVVPAQLSFLAIYNPSLGRSDETFDQQIVFYYSRAAKTRSKLGHGDTQRAHELREQENEKLRQVGLAQGMVGFAKSFSNGETVDSVETQKSRIVLHELEDGWWALASIDLTQLPAANTNTNTSTKTNSTSQEEPAVEYSAREVSPPALLIQQLVRAQSTFLLHHGITLETLFAKHGRSKFCSILDKYWSRFAVTWDVLLHASPAVDIYGGMKLAAGGELGMGVGEEDWGSSERDVLEDFARRTDGLVDVMVSRFGEASPLQHAKISTDPRLLDVTQDESWIGSGKSVHAADGVVFSGLGALSRKSLRDLSHWVETMYTHGEYAYGVRDNVTADRKKRQRRRLKPDVEARPSISPTPARNDRRSPLTTDSSSTLPLGIPPPIVKAVESSLDRASAAVENSTDAPDSKPILATLGDTDTWIKYMTLGYGTAWGGSGSKGAIEESKPTASSTVRERSPSPQAMRHIEPEPDVDVAGEKLKMQIQLENDGYFLVGLKGDLRDLDIDDDNDDGNWNNRIHLRTVHLEVDSPNSAAGATNGDDSDETPQYEREMNLRTTTESRLTRLRPVVYAHRPFIYTFLFSHQAYSLSMATFYRDIHNFFSPLHRSLESSTSPSRVAARLSAASNPYTTISSPSATASSASPLPIYDLVYDPRTYTVHSSIPNIPDPGTLIAEGLSSSTTVAAHGWSRIEALNVHAQILATVATTRRNLHDVETTSKTSRAWWVVWLRLPPSHAAADAMARQEEHEPSAQFDTHELREAFLVRRARDAVGPVTAKSGAGARFASGMWSGLGMGSATGQSQRMGGAAAGWGPKGLAEGIGIDARRYVEELLSLNR